MTIQRVTPEIAKELLLWETERDYSDRMVKHGYAEIPEQARFNRGRWGEEKAPHPTLVMSNCSSDYWPTERVIMCWALAHDRRVRSESVVIAVSDKYRRVTAGGQLLIDVVMTGMPADLDVFTVLAVGSDPEPWWVTQSHEYTI